MAFSLPVTDPTTGVKATYWRPTGVFVDLANRTARLYFSGYLSKKARDAEGSQPVATRELIATGAEFDKHFGPKAKQNALAAAYAYAKGPQSVTPNSPRVEVPDESPRPPVPANLVGLHGLGGDEPRTVWVPDTTSPFADAADA